MPSSVRLPYICLVRIGGPGGPMAPPPEQGNRSPYRPCGLPTADTIMVEGVETPACAFHRAASLGQALHRYVGPETR